MVYSLLQRKKAAHDWKPPDSESEVHGWAVSSNTPQESVGYLNHYFNCVDKKTCFLCELKLMEYKNYPCRCTIWCKKCKLWATTTHPLPHACIICREEVDSFIHKESRPQEDFGQTVQNVHGGKREEAALEFNVYNQGTFKTDLYNQGRFKTEGLEFDVYNQGRFKTELNPAMFKTGLDRGMFRTEPQRSWYGNNDQFAHGITDPVMFKTELSYRDNCQLAHWMPPVHQGAFKTELCNKWQQTGNCLYGDKCQFAHGITELRPVIRHPSYKTEVCRTFLAGKTCPYGHRCLFRHSLAE